MFQFCFIIYVEHMYIVQVDESVNNPNNKHLLITNSSCRNVSNEFKPCEANEFIRNLFIRIHTTVGILSGHQYFLLTSSAQALCMILLDTFLSQDFMRGLCYRQVVSSLTLLNNVCAKCICFHCRLHYYF